MSSLHTLFYVYLCLGVVGISLSLVSFLFGGADGMDSDTEMHLDGDHSDVGHTGITAGTIFSVRNIFAFIGGFGASGAAAINAGYSENVSLVFAFSGGFLIAFTVFLIFRIAMKQQGNSVPKIGKLVGKPATVVTDIPLGGYGEIRLSNEFGTATTLTAQSKDGAIVAGSRVEVTDVVGRTALVKLVA